MLADARHALGERAHAEFFTVQVEACTMPATRLADLRADLARSRLVTADAAAAHGCLLIASGTSPLAPPTPLVVSEGDRYRRISERYAPMLADRPQALCGCHLHVGVDSRGQALALAGHMGPWLPVIAALAANSPYLDGRDTGYASRRAVENTRWPTTGPAPLPDEAGYERTVSDLVRRGVLLDRRMRYWYARPSEHVPTLEIRVAGSNAELDTVVLLAALVRGLAATFLPRIDAGFPPPHPDEPRLRHAYDTAARYGLSEPTPAAAEPGWAGRSRLGRLLASPQRPRPHTATWPGVRMPSPVCWPKAPVPTGSGARTGSAAGVWPASWTTSPRPRPPSAAEPSEPPVAPRSPGPPGHRRTAPRRHAVRTVTAASPTPWCPRRGPTNTSPTASTTAAGHGRPTHVNAATDCTPTTRRAQRPGSAMGAVGMPGRQVLLVRRAIHLRNDTSLHRVKDALADFHGVTLTSFETQTPPPPDAPAPAPARCTPLALVVVHEFTLTTGMLFIVVTAARWMAGPGTPLTGLLPTLTSRLLVMGLLVGVIVTAVLGPSMRHETAGHLNPAVSIGLWMLHVFPGKAVLPFVVAQLAGSVAGVALADLVWGDAAAKVGYAALAPARGWGSGAVFALEASAMAVIMLIVAFFGTRPPLLRFLPPVIGACVTAVIVFLGPLSGGGGNPARQLGPAVFSGSTGHLWAYLLAPVAGASSAAALAPLMRRR
ncbi:YbdK family carboxylate-amine ligase [Streptomyces sp. BR123]|uniref:YbdK family carboxylate-amine ligase n=1 Tax=Streptomyces sp. BR123 TaxID=2749828 RepID=UPI0015C42D4E|nr:YbdK family carboxylate-amine ligase [Streptomyces sp. BR123]NXY94029.1 YbdK family carboxylate-amine ligase [Streptomyces sp. BR123]